MQGRGPVHDGRGPDGQVRLVCPFRSLQGRTREVVGVAGKGRRSGSGEVDAGEQGTWLRTGTSNDE